MTQGFLPAVTSGQYNTLRGVGNAPSYAGAQYASQLPNKLIFKAQLLTSLSGISGSFAQEAYHNVTVGAYTDPKPGQLLLLSQTDDMSKAYFTGRVRQSFDASNIYFNETSILQTVNDFIYVLDDYPVMDRLLLFDDGNNTYLADWSNTYRPLLPLIGSANDNVGLKGAYAGFIDPTSSKFRISLSALFYPSESAATITSWSVNLIDGTLISGSTSGSGTTTGTITADFPAGFRHVLITATNSAGTSSTLAVKVFAETRTGSATLITGHNGSTITTDVSNPGSAQTCSIELFTNELQSTLNNTPVVVWDEEVLNGTLGSVGGNVRFVGRLRKENNVAKASPKFVRTLSTKWTLEGPDAQLTRLENFKTFTVQNQVTPAMWGDIKSMTPYRALALMLTEFTTFCNSNVLNFDAYDDTFPYSILNMQGSNMLALMNDIAQSLNAQLQFSSDGRCLIARHAFYLSVAQRNALTTVANWGDTDRSADSDISIEDIHIVAQVDGWGGVWVGGGIPGTITPLHSMAPGRARDIGERSLPFLKQILANTGAAAAQNELNDRVGCHWLKEGAPVRLAVTHPGAYYGTLIPDVSAWYTWTISSSDNLRNLSYTTSTRWILEKVTQTHDNKAGKKKLDATYRQETNGLGLGQTIKIPVSTTFPGTGNTSSTVIPTPTIPGADSLNLNTNLTVMAAFDDSGNLFTTTTWANTSPTWTKTALGVSGTPVQFVVDAFSPRYLGSGTQVNGWLATSTNIYRISDIFGSVSATLQLTFGTSCLYRSMDFSFGTQNWGVCVSYYDSAGGTKATHTTDGITWTTEVTVTNNYISGFSTVASYVSGCYTSPKTPGLAYCTAFTNTPDPFTTPTAALFRSADYGATWSNYESTFSLVGNSETGGAFEIPYAAGNEITGYINRIHTTGPSAGTAQTMKVVGTSRTDISPSVSGVTYGPADDVNRWTIKSYPLNINYILMVAADYLRQKFGVFYTSTQGLSWTNIVAPSASPSYKRGAISGNNASAIYLFGPSGHIAYSANAGTTLNDKRGNLTSLSPGELIGICGG